MVDNKKDSYEVLDHVVYSMDYDGVFYELDISGVSREEMEKKLLEISPHHAYLYALHNPHAVPEEVRQRIISNLELALMYAMNIDLYRGEDIWNLLKNTRLRVKYVNWFKKKTNMHPDEYFLGKKNSDTITKLND